MSTNLLFLSWSFLLIPILIRLVTFSAVTHTIVAETGTTMTGDRLALLTIKSKIKDDPQRVLSSWNDSGTDFCQWQGITCSARHHRVTVLDLSSKGLVGTLSPSIGNLSFIRRIWLFGNLLSGEIPPEVGRLFRLRDLVLLNNSFTGNIPTTIMNCSNIQDLDLGDNNLRGKIPDGIGSLSMLKSLTFYKNVLEGGIPLFIANLTLLETLSLSHCQLGGSFPNIFQRLKNLKILLLTENNLVGTIPPSFYNCSSLEIVYFDMNKISGRLNLGSAMPYLQFLYLADNRLTSLETSNKGISSTMKNLMYLDISQNHIHGTLNFLGIPTTLKGADFSFNEFSGTLDPFLCSNGVMETRALYLTNNHFSGAIPDCWEMWSSLIAINFENNNLFGEIPRTLGSIPFLELLNLRGNKILGSLPSSLMNLSRLKVLQLGKNELAGSIPTWIGIKLTSLRILNLRSNKFNGSLPYQLCYLSHVQILDLAQNRLSGNIPGCFNNYSVLSGIENNSITEFSLSSDKYYFTTDDLLVIKGREYTYSSFLRLVMLLDLSSNNFSGQIPSELTALHELRSLNLSRNQLSGRISEKIGDMKALESFDLSLNKLSGEIPTGLSNLNFMSSFNVACNNLIGRIPIGTQIQSFNESNFFGNKLCGAPLNNSCAPLEVPGTKGDRKEKEDNRSHGKDWGLIISILLGFVAGFWIIVSSLIVNRSWRITFFRLLSKLIDYMVYDVMHNPC